MQNISYIGQNITSEEEILNKLNQQFHSSLADNNRFILLNLHFNKIHKISIHFFQNFKNIKRLVLSSNKLGPCFDLSVLFPTSRYLEELSLSNNGISTFDIQHTDGFEYDFKKLSRLDLSYNPIHLLCSENTSIVLNLFNNIKQVNISGIIISQIHENRDIIYIVTSVAINIIFGLSRWIKLKEITMTDEMEIIESLHYTPIIHYILINILRKEIVFLNTISISQDDSININVDAILSRVKWKRLMTSSFKALVVYDKVIQTDGQIIDSIDHMYNAQLYESREEQSRLPSQKTTGRKQSDQKRQVSYTQKSNTQESSSTNCRNKQRPYRQKRESTSIQTSNSIQKSDNNKTESSHKPSPVIDNLFEELSRLQDKIIEMSNNFQNNENFSEISDLVDKLGDNFNKQIVEIVDRSNALENRLVLFEKKSVPNNQKLIKTIPQHLSKFISIYFIDNVQRGFIGLESRINHLKNFISKLQKSLLVKTPLNKICSVIDKVITVKRFYLENELNIQNKIKIKNITDKLEFSNQVEIDRLTSEIAYRDTQILQNNLKYFNVMKNLKRQNDSIMNFSGNLINNIFDKMDKMQYRITEFKQHVISTYSLSIKYHRGNTNRQILNILKNSEDLYQSNTVKADREIQRLRDSFENKENKIHNEVSTIIQLCDHKIQRSEEKLKIAMEEKTVAIHHSKQLEEELNKVEEKIQKLDHHMSKLNEENLKKFEKDFSKKFTFEKNREIKKKLTDIFSEIKVNLNFNLQKFEHSQCLCIDKLKGQCITLRDSAKRLEKYIKKEQKLHLKTTKTLQSKSDQLDKLYESNNNLLDENKNLILQLSKKDVKNREMEKHFREKYEEYKIAHSEEIAIEIDELKNELKKRADFEEEMKASVKAECQLEYEEKLDNEIKNVNAISDDKIRRFEEMYVEKIKEMNLRNKHLESLVDREKEKVLNIQKDMELVVKECVEMKADYEEKLAKISQLIT